jgi:hypothetical protein
MGICKAINNSSTPPRGLELFFRLPPGSATSNLNTSLDASSQTKLLLARLCAPLKLPNLSQLTHSQRLFSIATDTDVRMLVIKEQHEFFLFMDIRADWQWTSFSMTPRKWVLATEHYNSCLEDLNKKASSPTIKKNPRALMEALGGVEEKVTSRLIKNDFICTQSSLVLPVRPLTQSTDSYQVQDRDILEMALFCCAPGETRIPTGRKKGTGVHNYECIDL